jgi:divalent metal cation (Fe/Co/Zn/Cd) transporter
LFYALLVPHDLDLRDSIDDALGQRARTRATTISLLGLIMTAILQSHGVIISSSMALLADTVHDLADALTAVPLWIEFALSRRRAIRRYTSGSRTSPACQSWS